MNEKGINIMCLDLFQVPLQVCHAAEVPYYEQDDMCLRSMDHGHFCCQCLVLDDFSHSIRLSMVHATSIMSIHFCLLSLTTMSGCLSVIFSSVGIVRCTVTTYLPVWSIKTAGARCGLLSLALGSKRMFRLLAMAWTTSSITLSWRSLCKVKEWASHFASM